MGNILIKNAKAIITLNAEDAVLENTNILIKDNYIGYIGKECFEDLFMIDTNRLEYVGARLDPRSILATVGVSGPVAYTIVNGEIVVKDGELCKVEEVKIVQRANNLVNKLLSLQL